MSCARFESCLTHVSMIEPDVVKWTGLSGLLPYSGVSFSFKSRPWIWQVKINYLHTIVRFYSTPHWEKSGAKTLRKKWSQNGSTPGAVSWCVTQLHLWHYFGRKRLHPPRWHQFPKRLQDGAILGPLFSQCNSISIVSNQANWKKYFMLKRDNFFTFFLSSEKNWDRKAINESGKAQVIGNLFAADFGLLFVTRVRENFH